MLDILARADSLAHLRYILRAQKVGTNFTLLRAYVPPGPDRIALRIVGNIQKRGSDKRFINTSPSCRDWYVVDGVRLGGANIVLYSDGCVCRRRRTTGGNAFTMPRRRRRTQSRTETRLRTRVRT